MATFKAITLHQPWATAVADGLKQIETRSWSTKHRGPLIIHAGKQVDRGVSEAHGYDPDSLSTGAHVATCYLIDVAPIVENWWIDDSHHEEGKSPWNWHEFDVEWWDLQIGWGDFSPGRFAWLLGSVVPITTPVPARGRQGLWNAEIVSV